MGCGGSYKGDARGGVDDRCILLFISSEGEDGMLAAEPNPFRVGALGKVPRGFCDVDCITILKLVC